MVEIEHRSHQCDEREDDNHATYHLINNKDAIGIKLALILSMSQVSPNHHSKAPKMMLR